MKILNKIIESLDLFLNYLKLIVIRDNHIQIQ